MIAIMLTPAAPAQTKIFERGETTILTKRSALGKPTFGCLDTLSSPVIHCSHLSILWPELQLRVVHFEAVMM